jgi:cytoskeletal protein CcmA (bactofilin family)
MSNTTSNVPADVQIHGSIKFGGEMTFAGRLTGGNIKGPVLTVAPEADITGNIDSDACTIFATVKGNVSVSGKCDLKSSAVLVGDLTTSKLVMGDGATFIGKADIRPGKGSTSAPGTKAP